MKRLVTTIFITVFLLTTLILPLTHVLALTDDEKRLQDIQQQIATLQAQLDNARGQEKTLKSQLDVIDTQNKLTKLKIDQTNTQLDQLQSEITGLSSKISNLSTTVDSMSQLLLNRIVQTYKYGTATPIELFLSANGFSDLLIRAKYLQVAQANDKKILYQLQATKAAYNDQKVDKLSREAQQKKLKKDLENYQNQLDSQKLAKQEILRITKNDEATYQAKIKSAQDEQNAILSILNGNGQEKLDGPIKKGDVIAHVIVGVSACSSGTHLHFEVHQNDNLVDPAHLLANHNVSFQNTPDGSFSFSGSWDLWPLYDPINISQGYGSTWWAQHGWYKNPPGHTGIDMYRSGGDASAVLAVHDGNLYSDSISCGGGTLHYKRVDHGDSTSSYYLHVL